MKTKLVLLGTGSPACQPDSFQSSASVIVDDRPYLIDCGGGTVQRISMAQDKGISELGWKNLRHLIVTHLHPDHTVGLADLIISTWVRGRTEPLRIYGPAGIAKMVDLILQAYELGIAEHRRHEDYFERPFRYEVMEYTAGYVIQDEHITIEAFEVSHGQLETYGLKVTTADKTIVFSSDTQPHPNVIENAKGCDILVHEAYSTEGLRQSNRHPTSYFSAMHTSTKQLAEVAQAAKPSKLIITHKMHLALATDTEFLQEITETYDGEVVMGQDLDVYV